MASPYIGEIRMFGGSFAPLGYAFCNGQLLAISQYDALYALLGTTYGGDGQTSFGLPDLRGRVPVHQGSGAGLSSRTIGERAGNESVTLISSQFPAHSHTVIATTNPATTVSPANAIFAASPAPAYVAPASQVALSPTAIGSAGGSQPHDNMMPYACINFIIALEGFFPPRS